MKRKEELSCWIRLLQIENIGPRSFNKILEALKQENKSVADLFKIGIKELGFLLEKNKIRRIAPTKVLRTKYEGIEKLLNTLEEKEIRVLMFDDSDYPNSIKSFLSENAPPILYAFGNLGLLDKKSLAIVGSRHASEASVDIAQSVARSMVKEDICIVSGYAAGVDSAAHLGALKNNGTTIIILPHGILNFKWKEYFNNLGELRERVLILSEFYPNAKWNNWSAMQRNKTIVALAGGVFAVEFREEGGTFDTMKRAVRLRKPLFVIDNEDNRKILQRNNISPIYVDPKSVNLEKTILLNIEKVSQAIDRQISLF
jgi:DNA processing protein